jgi:hypothetical protein
VKPGEDAPQFRLENIEVKAKRAKKYDEANIGLRDRFAKFAHRRQGIASRREPASYRAAPRHAPLLLNFPGDGFSGLRRHRFAPPGY